MAAQILKRKTTTSFDCWLLIMRMKEKILISIKIIKAELPLILVLAFLNQLSWTIKDIALLSIFLGFILRFIIFARGAEFIKSSNSHTSLQEKFQIYFKDYLIISIIIWVISILLMSVLSLGFEQFWFLHFNSLIIAILTIYVFPFLFVKNTRVNSIIYGIKFLQINFKKSIPLIAIIASPGILGLLFRAISPSILETSHPSVLMLLRYISAFITVCFTVAPFYIATMILLEHKETWKTAPLELHVWHVA